MRMLVLGGTAWLGRELSRQALTQGWEVTCLARGESGAVADGARLITADRTVPGAYTAVAEQDWDSVVEIAWQPGMVREALTTLARRARHWIYISSGNVYASHAALDADESAGLLPSTDVEVAGIELYGQAKVACELAARETVGADRLLIARSGLIGGPGDASDRAGYWVARAARDPHAPVLTVTGAAGKSTQVIDVRDLAAWLVRCATAGTAGTFDTVGVRYPLAHWITESLVAGGHDGPAVAADDAWLLAHGVGEFMGPDSLPLWLADPEWIGFSARSGAAARAAGLTHRPTAETITDTLAWERELGLTRERSAGLSPAREAELIAELTAG